MRFCFDFLGNGNFKSEIFVEIFYCIKSGLDIHICYYQLKYFKKNLFQTNPAINKIQIYNTHLHENDFSKLYDNLYLILKNTLDCLLIQENTSNFRSKPIAARCSVSSIVKSSFPVASMDVKTYKVSTIV